LFYIAITHLTPAMSHHYNLEEVDYGDEEDSTTRKAHPSPAVGVVDSTDRVNHLPPLVRRRKAAPQEGQEDPPWKKRSRGSEPSGDSTERELPGETVKHADGESNSEKNDPSFKGQVHKSTSPGLDDETRSDPVGIVVDETVRRDGPGKVEKLGSEGTPVYETQPSLCRETEGSVPAGGGIPTGGLPTGGGSEDVTVQSAPLETVKEEDAHGGPKGPGLPDRSTELLMQIVDSLGPQDPPLTVELSCPSPNKDAPAEPSDASPCCSSQADRFSMKSSSCLWQQLPEAQTTSAVLPHEQERYGHQTPSWGDYSWGVPEAGAWDAATALPPTRDPAQEYVDEDLIKLLEAFRIILSLDLPCVLRVDVGRLFSSSLGGYLSLPYYYKSLLKEVTSDSTLNETILEVLGVPAEVPNVHHLPNYHVDWYVETVLPGGHKHSHVLTDEELKTSVLASELHIGLSHTPSDEDVRRVLLSMPPWYLVKSYQAAKIALTPEISEAFFLGIRGKEAIEILEKKDVDADMLQNVCAYHRDYVEGLMMSGVCKVTLHDVDSVLMKRVSLSTGPLKDERFKVLEEYLTPGFLVKSIRRLGMKLSRPDIYPEVYREIQEVCTEGRRVSLFNDQANESTAFSKSWQSSGAPSKNSRPYNSRR
jgi:hypothetical protein